MNEGTTEENRRLLAEIETLRQRLDVAERALAEERLAWSKWREQGLEKAIFELSPQSLDNLARKLEKARRAARPLRRFIDVFRRER
jgi:hypothetical protein